jgi:hypothetical protein
MDKKKGDPRRAMRLSVRVSAGNEARRSARFGIARNIIRGKNLMGEDASYTPLQKKDVHVSLHVKKGVRGYEERKVGMAHPRADQESEEHCKPVQTVHQTEDFPFYRLPGGKQPLNHIT